MTVRGICHFVYAKRMPSQPRARRAIDVDGQSAGMGAGEAGLGVFSCILLVMSTKIFTTILQWREKLCRSKNSISVA